ncbi:uncharacterized protein LOC132599182 [Lycium barbarum]|uniref:uncharacterized protein LOC132599182 n=1 Tax=Lycium barbarum TaxID=112863 RepID=UPI00293EB51D|nr:uncharacterized protein LOC132599182 [Lycium barbarum]XP_060168417.1 uncharacterized protein LOC132599182 [Lycium barbarum]XP_060168418.1 uncharacterized protein LOC132599182 [Lycium barbarum]XP_060168419.1 uncharacterized protein LOC132599182 [Lycium barbarum]XP_060168421.1 uncharacterized protein LOC132599182 [Lycium barbarum]
MPTTTTCRDSQHFPCYNPNTTSRPIPHTGRIPTTIPGPHILQFLFHLQGTSRGQTPPSDDSSPNTNLRYRVECPTLRQRIDIPNPQNPSLCIALDFVPFNHPAVKLLSVHGDDESSLGYEILALGVGSDQTTYCWRSVKVPLPNLSHEKRKSIQVFFRMGVAYCIWHVQRDAHDDLTDIQVDVLDMVNETYIGRTTFPRGFFSSTNLMDWNGRLSFAQLLKDELHVLVLNDYRKLKWDERTRIIKLKFLQPDDGEQLTFITFADNSILFFVNQNKNLFFAYDINTGKLITCTLPNCIESFEEVVHIITEMMFYRGGGFYDY